MADVTITILDGQLGSVSPSIDGVAAIIGTGDAAGTPDLETKLGPFFSLSDVEAAGINAAYDTTYSTKIWKHCKDFFTAAGNGNELYVWLCADTVTMAQMLDPTLTHAKSLLDELMGRIRLLAVSRNPAVIETAVNGISPDVTAALAKGTLLWADQFALKRPIQIIIEGRVAGAVGDLDDLTQNSDNRVSVVFGDYADDYEGAAVGLLLGRLAKIPVQRNPGRVKATIDNGVQTGGPIEGQTVMYYYNAGAPVTIEQLGEGSVKVLTDKSYILPKVYVGKSGYFWNDAFTASARNLDFFTIDRGRVMDKAVRIAYDVYVNELLDDFAVNPNTSKIPPAIIKAFQQAVKKQLDGQMTANGEISGCRVVVDPNQDVISTGKVIIKIFIVPVAHAREIELTIGFENPNA